jgi:hypothetical protein
MIFLGFNTKGDRDGEEDGEREGDRDGEGNGRAKERGWGGGRETEITGGSSR